MHGWQVIAMSNSIIPTVVLQEVMDAMDDMATDSRLLDMKQSRVHQFDAARDALRAALDNLQCGCEQNLNMIPAGWKLVPDEPTMSMQHAALISSRAHGPVSTGECNALPISYELGASAMIYRAMLAASPQPPALEQVQANPSPYLWYDPENGYTWTQEAVDEGFCATDSLIPLYTK